MFYDEENATLRCKKWHFTLVKDVKERETRYPSPLLIESQLLISP